MKIIKRFSTTRRACRTPDFVFKGVRTKTTLADPFIEIKQRPVAECGTADYLGNIVKAISSWCTVHNYILLGKDGKTPAERLGLAQVPLDYEDIIYFS